MVGSRPPWSLLQGLPKFKLTVAVRSRSRQTALSPSWQSYASDILGEGTGSVTISIGLLHLVLVLFGTHPLAGFAPSLLGEALGGFAVLLL